MWPLSLDPVGIEKCHCSSTEDVCTRGTLEWGDRTDWFSQQQLIAVILTMYVETMVCVCACCDADLKGCGAKCRGRRGNIALCPVSTNYQDWIAVVILTFFASFSSAAYGCHGNETSDWVICPPKIKRSCAQLNHCPFNKTWQPSAFWFCD